MIHEANIALALLLDKKTTLPKIVEKRVTLTCHRDCISLGFRSRTRRSPGKICQKKMHRMVFNYKRSKKKDFTFKRAVNLGMDFNRQENI